MEWFNHLYVYVALAVVVFVAFCVLLVRIGYAFGLYKGFDRGFDGLWFHLIDAFEDEGKGQLLVDTLKKYRDKCIREKKGGKVIERTNHN